MVYTFQAKAFFQSGVYGQLQSAYAVNALRNKMTGRFVRTYFKWSCYRAHDILRYWLVSTKRKKSECGVGMGILRDARFFLYMENGIFFFFT